MYPNQLPIFKELNPYCGQIDTNNRWIKLAELVPWDEIDPIYRKHFDARKQSVIKSNRLIMGLMLGQMLMELSDKAVLEYFHENPYFQYFCGQDTFMAKLDKPIIHSSLLSKRRRRLGSDYARQFEQAVLMILKKRGLIKGKKLIQDATIFPANITYPNDVKLLNTVRDYLCKTILIVKNSIAPKQKIRTYRRMARRTYLNFQKTKKKSKQFIRRTRKSMIQYANRNIKQLDFLLTELKSQMKQHLTAFKQWQYDRIVTNLLVAKKILEQQLHMATTRGRHVANRIVSFHWPEIRPMVRGKDGKAVEFGPKAHVALIDGYALLDHCQFDSFNEGIRLEESLDKHEARFGRQPDIVLADQIYANRNNRHLLKDRKIEHSFRRIGRPPDEPKADKQKHQQTFRKRQGNRNHIEATFGHLKNRFNLDRLTWTVPGGANMQIQLGLIALNLQKAATAA
jgi:transposase, IS5 family